MIGSLFLTLAFYWCLSALFPTPSHALLPDATLMLLQLADAVFSSDDANDKFLREFILKRGWVDKGDNVPGYEVCEPGKNEKGRGGTKCDQVCDPLGGRGAECEHVRLDGQGGRRAVV